MTYIFWVIVTYKTLTRNFYLINLLGQWVLFFFIFCIQSFWKKFLSLLDAVLVIFFVGVLNAWQKKIKKMVYLGLLPVDISQNSRKVITTGSFLCEFTKNPHPRIINKNFTVGILYSLSLMCLRSPLLGTKILLKVNLSGSSILLFIIFCFLDYFLD